jgi:hypothetical protein
LNDERIQNPSNPFGIVPLSNFVPRGFGFVHHSIAILYHEVPNPTLTIRDFSSQYAGGLQTLGWQRELLRLYSDGVRATHAQLVALRDEVTRKTATKTLFCWR